LAGNHASQTTNQKSEGEKVMSVNKVTLIGNIGNTPEVRVLSSGSSVANFSIATSEKWKDKQTGQMQEKTEWHNCKAFDHGNYLMGKYIAEGCQRGTKIYVEGKLETEEYEKDGIKRYATKVNVTEFEILANGIPKDQQGQAQQPAPQGYGQAPAGSWGDPWQGLKPAGAAAHLTIEQIKADPSVNGNAQAALNFGWAVK
jgi:single-strand DNA-binding protein